MLAEAASIAGLFFQIVSAVGVLVAIWASLRNHGEAQSIKFEINGRMNELLKLTAEHSRQQGIQIGRAEASQPQINPDNP